VGKDAFDAALDAAEARELELLREENRRIKRELGRKARNEDVIAIEVRRALETLPKVKVVAPTFVKKAGATGPRGKPDPATRGSEEVAILCISDTQIGKVTATYDVATAERRVLAAGQKTAKIAELRRSVARIDECCLWLIGDIVEGESIFAGQPYEIEIGAMQQSVQAAPQILASLIAQLAQAFNRVRVRCVVGNHGRVGSISFAAHPKTNWDRVAYETTGILLKGVKGHAEIDYRVADDFYVVEQVLGHGHLLAHGDQIGGAGTDGPIRQAAMGWIDSIRAPWKYLWLGHFHNPRWLTVNHRVVIVNGSTESDNLYAQRQLKAQTDPLQWLAFANAEHGIVSLSPLYLRDV
jgi:hypothetical protein